MINQDVKEVRMVDLKGQYERIKPEIDTAIQSVLDETAFIKGRHVKAFTQSFAEYLGVKHVIGCANGTDALQLALMALDLKPGDEVITTSFTFVATIEVICLLGLKPVFVDVSPESFNIDPSKLREVITERSRCIIPVHLFGQSADMDPIMDIAQEYGLKVVEDTAQAVSATYDTRSGTRTCGTMGDVGTFSFFPSKNLGCYGDGGAVCTNDDALAEKINLFANHGSKRKYYYDEIGINSRLDGIQAAILSVKLKHLDDYNLARIKAAERYDQLLQDVSQVTLPARKSGRDHMFHQYTIKVKNRDVVKEALSSQAIPTGVYYPAPLHTQPIYAPLHPADRPLPVTEELCETVLSLPMHTELDWDTQHHIVEALLSAL